MNHEVKVFRYNNLESRIKFTTLSNDWKRTEVNTVIYNFPDAKFSAKHVGKSLMKLIEVNSSPIEIAQWTYNIFHHYNRNITGDVRKKFMSLMFMEEGPEFELSKEELLKLADELINSEEDSL